MRKRARVGVRALVAAGVLCVLACASCQSSRKRDDLPTQSPKAAASMGGLARKLIDGLEALAAQTPKLKARTVGVLNFNYEDTRMGSRLSIFLRGGLEEALGGHVRVIERAELEELLREQGLQLSTIVDESSSVELGKIKGVDVLVRGRFWPMKRTCVHVAASATYVAYGNKVSASVDIPNACLPDIQIQPHAASIRYAKLADEVRRMITEMPGSGLRITLSVDSAKEVYAAGETLVFRFKANQNCYLNLYNYTSDNKVALVFPNEYQRDSHIEAGKEYRIPDEHSAFDLKARAPFGGEIVQAIASTDRLGFFRDPTRLFASPEDFSRNVRSVVPEARIGVSSSAQWAEAQVGFATVAR